jgi:hypothetical protein
VSLLCRRSFGVALGAGALIVAPAFGPLAAQVQAAPTIGGDENGPQVQILQPTYQEVLRGNTKILIAVKARKFNPQSVEMFIDDKPNSSGPLALSGLVSSQFNWPTADLTDGPHKLTVRVTDVQGFRGWAEVNVYINNGKKVDSLPPSLGWLNLDPFQQLSGQADIQLQATDNFGIKWIIVTVNPASEPNKKPALRSWLLNKPPYRVKFDTSRVDDGLYQFSAKAWDSFEQEGVANPLTVGIINRGGINATTIEEMLKTMRQMNPAPRPLLANTLKPNVEAPSAPKAAPPIVTRPKTAVKAGAATPKKALSPSFPSILGRAVPKTRTQIARGGANRSAVVPRLSVPKMPKLPAAQGASAFEAEIQGALADDWRTKLAGSAPKAAPATSLSPSATLSAPRSPGDLSFTGRRVDTDAQKETANRFASERIAAPVGEARAVSGPAWSQNTTGSGGQLTSILPFKVEAEAVRPKGRVSGPNALTARNVAEPVEKLAAKPAPSLQSASSLQSTPAFSATGSPTAPRLTDRVLPSIDVPQSGEGSLRVAAPLLGGQRAVPNSSSAALSVSGAAASPNVSAKGPLAITVESLTARRAGKASSPDKNRLALLPRPSKSAARGPFNAITVSPLEIKASDAIPAFHHVARSTDLRAVAARYGLPVAVVAACNNWPANMKLVAGTAVKLPQQLKVAYQGVPVQSDAPSLLVGGTGVTAFRFMFEQAGGKMEWDAKRQRVIARKGKSEVVLKIGSNRVKVGDKDVMMELAAFLFEGRTMVPVRFFEEGLHAQVEWDPQTGRIVVAMSG